ncbi:hypothetical protein AB5I41_22880 [Sphingomonas sp. MMS24-JH45]
MYEGTSRTTRTAGIDEFTHLQGATATYDALGRMTGWREAGNPTIGNYTVPPAALTFQYDAAGNVRRQVTEYTILNPDGSFGATGTQDHWYRYDAMNRVVTTKGALVNGQIVRGAQYSISPTTPAAAAAPRPPARAARFTATPPTVSSRA